MIRIWSGGGLVPGLLLAESAGLHDLLDEHLSIGSPNPVVKSAGVVAGMLAGADSIDEIVEGPIRGYGLGYDAETSD